VLASSLIVLAGAAVPLAFAGGARSSVPAALRAATACGATVKVPEQTTFKINQYVQDSMRFVPGTVTIKSGCMLTFKFATPGQSDPHTLSIVNQAQLPKTIAQIENCKICQQIGAKHVKNPTQPPGPKNPVLHWIVNVGKPGLDAPGDSIAILEAPGAPPGHKSVTVPVSAPAGTTLYFLCAVHPWMQGKIIVK
jgi:plastocyanin